MSPIISRVGNRETLEDFEDIKINVVQMDEVKASNSDYTQSRHFSRPKSPFGHFNTYIKPSFKVEVFDSDEDADLQDSDLEVASE